MGMELKWGIATINYTGGRKASETNWGTMVSHWFWKNIIHIHSNNKESGNGAAEKKFQE